MNVLPVAIFVAVAAYACTSPAAWAAVSGDNDDSDAASRFTQGTCAAHDRLPWVIAHRGASGTLPEHTLEAYRLAIRQGADFIEPDLVPTADGALIARHERALAQVALDADGSVVRDAGLPRVVHATTNVADLPEFAERLTVKTISGRAVGGWFSDDFTLAEIGRLRARERVPAIRPGNALNDDRYRIATWPEILDLAERASETSGRSVGLMPELKFPGSPGLTSDAAARLIADVKESGFGGCVVVQSFEPVVLFRMRHVLFPKEGLNWPLVQLVGSFDSPLSPSHSVFPDVRDSWQHARDALLDDPASDRARLTSPTGLDWLAQTYADALGIDAGQVLAAADTQSTTLVGSQSRLPILVYTLRAEPEFGRTEESVLALWQRVFALPMLGAFSDHPRAMVALRELLGDGRGEQQR